MTTSPVYTTENECQDCYKCVRHCPVKAIRIVNGKASVIPEACVACGECVKVCPAHAKKIRSDLARLKEMLASGEPLYASVAPSFAGYFKGVTIGQRAGALKRIGFAEVSETAHGAESVSAHVARLLDATDSPLVISSACPAAVDMVRKYLPGYAQFISPLPSPVRAHCRLIKEKFGSKAKVVFFGPCAAKKTEADAHPDELALAVIFPALEKLFEEKGVDLVEISPTATPPVCRLIDYSKFLYQQKKRQKEIKAKQVKISVKEIRFGPQTDDHDYDFKLKHAREFLTSGNKVKAYVFFKGRSIVFKEQGEVLLLRFATDLEDVGKVESMPELMGKRMTMFIAPKKMPSAKAKQAPTIQEGPKKNQSTGGPKANVQKEYTGPKVEGED